MADLADVLQLALTDDDDLATSNESIVKAMGSIVVRVDRVQSAHREQAVYDSRKVGNLEELFLLCCLERGS